MPSGQGDRQVHALPGRECAGSGPATWCSPPWTLAPRLTPPAWPVDASLVSPAAWRRVGALALQIDASATSCVYLECALASRGHRVDVAFHSARSPAERASDGLPTAVCGTWQEFDLPPTEFIARRACPRPHVMYDFCEPELLPDASGGCDDAVLEATGWIARRFAPGTMRALDAITRHLPAPARIAYVGVMHRQAEPSMRLCVSNLAPDELMLLLRRVRWPGNFTEVDRLLREAIGAGQDQPALVHLDVAPALTGAIGLEYPLDRRAQLAGTIRELALLDLVVRRGYCTGRQRRALEFVPRYHVRTLAHELWPSIVVHRVNHLKFVSRPGQCLRVKAYLCMEHRPRTRRVWPAESSVGSTP